MSIKKSALGRGLSALLQDEATDVTSKNDITGSTTVVGAVANIPVDKIEANPFQPRTDFEEEALQELSASIKEQGIIQPVTVRKLGYDRYQLISGERRLRASKLAGLEHIPAYIRIANDQGMLEMALVENIQRENLNPVEIAISYKRLIEECDITQEQLSDRVGKNRSTVTNYMRLLKLPPEIQIGLRDGKITMGHARALLAVENIDQQLALYKRFLEGDISVRAAEELVRKKVHPERVHQDTSTYKSISDNLASKLETKVTVKGAKNGNGKIEISFYSTEDLNRLLDLFNY